MNTNSVAETLTLKQVVEIIMAQHWDIGACDCWICEAGRKRGAKVWSENLPHNRTVSMGFVRVDGAWMEKGNDTWGRKPE